MKVINQGVRSEHDYGKEGGRDYDGGKMKMRGSVNMKVGQSAS